MADELNREGEAGQAAASETAAKRGVSLRMLGAIVIVIAAIMLFAIFQSLQETNEANAALEKASQDYIASSRAASEMIEGSHYLTIQVRTCVVKQDSEYIDRYFWEANVNQRRQRAVATLESIHADGSKSLQAALDDSIELMELEYYAMRLIVEALGKDVGASSDLPAELKSVVLSPEDAALSSDGKVQRAIDIVFGDEYLSYVDQIEGNVAQCEAELIERMGSIQAESQARLNSLLLRLQVLAVLLFIGFITMLIAFVVLVQRPLRLHSERIKNGDPLPHTGARELRNLSDAYNAIYEETMLSHDALRRKAEHDSLTGLYNREVFERLLATHRYDHYALMLIDVDYFKEINDTYGHDTGDAMLKKLSRLLSHVFRATDYPCRIGGDEFVVVMTEMAEDLKYVVEAKIRTVSEGLADVSDGLPSSTLSIGVAFNDGTLEGSQVYKNADQALYRVKEAGRNGYGFFDGRG